MLKILVFAAVATLIIVGSAHYKKLNPEQRRNALWKMGTGLFLCLLVLLVAFGKIHWLGAVLGALLPFLRNAYGLASQLLPFWLQRKKAQQDSQYQEPPKPTPVPMAIQEALDVLGLTGDVTKGEITQPMILDAHRKLIQKVHPDRGGNDYLAAKINQARDQLLEVIKH
ncbi:MAG TPA: molecular chaperone DnaJ [Cellvibrio sp.]|nr:molecular chaperone DnaJ [Cellvibrio sp.]